MQNLASSSHASHLDLSIPKCECVLDPKIAFMFHNFVSAGAFQDSHAVEERAPAAKALPIRERTGNHTPTQPHGPPLPMDRVQNTQGLKSCMPEFLSQRQEREWGRGRGYGGPRTGRVGNACAKRSVMEPRREWAPTMLASTWGWGGM